MEELVRRGHELLWYTGEQFASKIESAGAERTPMRAGRDLSPTEIDAMVRARGGRSGVAGLQWDFKHLFIDHALAYRHYQKYLQATVQEFGTRAAICLGMWNSFGPYFLPRPMTSHRLLGGTI